MDEVLARLRSAPGLGPYDVRFAATGGPLEKVWHRAVAELADYCIRPVDGSGPVLIEGGPYHGSWIEGTGTISAEVLGRFLPEVARETFLLYAGRQRDDGLLPYKVTDAGGAYRQIQMVSPLARSVWNHFRFAGSSGGPDDGFLRRMYGAMVGHDDWLARYRDTRGTGCVEAFCTFDTGHDASPRFWHVPDTTHLDDPTRYAPDSPILPFLAPDLTANVACQRRYLARIAEELGDDPAPWYEAAKRSLDALFAQCYDEVDGLFYDRDAQGSLVRVASDVLLRVLACEIGDDEFFAAALRRYLLSTRKFFARYPFTSIALDDPRFSQDFTRNSWAGPTNFLTLLRAPQAFEHHGRHVELAFALIPVLAAVARMTRFPQTLNPWTGEQGFTEQYSPTILWLLDTVERLCGILYRPDGEVWFSGLAPYAVDHEPVVDTTGYARTVGGKAYELVNTTTEVIAYRNAAEFARFPHGWRLVTTVEGSVLAVVGLSPRPVSGELALGDLSVPLTIAGNERVELDTNGTAVSRSTTDVISPTY